jgi:UDP-2,4-diacetamido-2,4,6-trideoxy-beta-L-altropyranose hydrolase
VKVIFRTDASVEIGVGHVMRCLTLADALRSNGADCKFICCEHKGNLIEQIRQRGHVAVSLPINLSNLANNNVKDGDVLNHTSWLGNDWATDAAQTKVIASEAWVDWLIVDHYALDIRWEESLRPSCRKIMVIDDLADRPHDCDLLLDQNLGRITSDYSSLVPNDCIVLAGPYYALLRPEFAEFRAHSLRRRTTSKIENLLITMGGVDQADATGHILQSLIESWLPKEISVTVVMGSYAPWLERVKSIAAKMPNPTKVMVNVQNMAELMANSDLAIGASGSTSWERCSLGLPSLIGVFADNQKSIANALSLSGAAKKFDGTVELNRMLQDLYNNLELLANISAQAAKVTDGCGTQRVVARFLENEST